MLGFDILWNTGAGATRSSWSTGAGLIRWISGIEPEHVSIMIIPDGHNEDHTVDHGLTHLLETTLFLEVVSVSHNTLLGCAHFIGDRIVLFINSGNVGCWVLKNLTILYEDSSDF